MDLNLKAKLLGKQWYPPNLVFQRFNELVKKYSLEIVDTKVDFKSAREMRAVAFMLFGQHLNDGYKYMMLPASETDETPDVYTLFQTEHPLHTHIQTVEVVTFKGNSGNDVGQFILDTKLLNRKKAYDAQTIILCEIRKETAINFDYLYKQFRLTQFTPENVYIIGEVRNSYDWLLTQVWPTFGQKQYSVVEQSNKYPVKKPSTYRSGQGDIINSVHNPNIQPHNMYEMFGLDEDSLNRKFGKD